MTINHLRDEELDCALAGERLAPESEEHLATCLVCRRRHSAFMAAVAGARGADPDAETRTRVRESALSAWGGRSRGRRWLRYLAAAAAVVVLGLLPVLRPHTAGSAKLDAGAVMVEVDDVLARDPLASVASEDIVNTVVPEPEESLEGSWS